MKEAEDFGPQDRAFLDTLGKEAQTSLKTPDLLQQLKKDEVGRLLQWKVPSRSNELILQDAGYVLELTETSHVVLFPDGQVMVTEPSKPDSEFTVSKYKELFTPGSISNISSDWYTPEVTANHFFYTGERYSAKVTLSNRNPGQREQVEELFRVAMERAYTRKQDLEDGRSHGAQLMGNVTDIFKNIRRDDSGNNGDVTQSPPAA